MWNVLRRSIVISEKTLNLDSDNFIFVKLYKNTGNDVYRSLITFSFILLF